MAKGPKVTETVKRLLALETKVETGFVALRAETHVLGEAVAKLNADVNKGLVEVVEAVDGLRTAIARALEVDARVTQLELRVDRLERPA
jgi:hypothetical protein